MGRKRLALLVAVATTASAAIWAQPTTPPPDEVKANVVKVLRTTNKAQVNQYVCKTYDIKNVNPFDVLNYPELLAEAEEGMIYSFIHPDGNKGKILVTCPQYQIPYFDQLIPALDRPDLNSFPGSTWMLYRAKHRPPGSLAQYGQYYAGSQDVLYPDFETNSVLFWGVGSGWESTKAALDKIDCPSPQALIEVSIYDVKLNNDGTFGLDFHAWKNGPGRFLGASGVRFQWLGINKAAGVPTYTAYHGRSHHGQGYFLDYPSAYFDFLVERGKAKVLTTTKLAALNNQTAHFSTGEQVLFYRVTQTNVLDRKVTAGTQPRGVGEHATPLAHGVIASLARTLGISQTPVGPLAIQPVPTGVFLDVTPIINRELVDMDINARVVTLVGYDDTGQPVLSSRQFADRAQVGNGEELVIGGLVRERKVKGTRKIPILGSIPVLGWAFGGEITGAEKTMVVAVVRPVVDEFDSPVRPGDRETMAAAAGETAIPMPETPYGFDQWLFD
ncbi:MAG: hypothetical protein AMJ84_13835, partial [Acidithiobacillales bacterium SM23_46]